MNVSIIIDNLLHPPALFFSLGMIASFCKSDIKIPEPLPKLFVTIQRNLLNYRRSERDSFPNLVLNILKYLFGNVIALETLFPVRV